MGLFSFLRRDRSAANDRAPRGRRVGDLPSADIVRTQARRRLIGAAVLVVIAVLVLPLLFDSKPRPLPVDIPIDLPKRDLSAALPEPPPPRTDSPSGEAPRAASGDAAVATQTRPAASSAAASPAGSTSEPAVAKPTEAPKPAPKPEAAKPDVARPESRKTAEVHPPKPAPKPEAKPEPKAEPKAEPKPEPKPAKSTAGDAARAQAALEGRESAAASIRYVVQVGAFEQADGAREARQRVAKVGLQAHESVVQTADGKRIRVRLGPFASREEADKAAAKLRSAGLGGAVVPQ